MTRRRTRTITAVAVAAMVAVLAAGCDWVGPGADASRSGYNPSAGNLTVTNVASLAETFRTAAGSSDAPPVVTADGVFVTSLFDTSGFDRKTGAERWRTSMDPEPAPPIELSSSVVANPARRRVLQTTHFSYTWGIPASGRWLDTRTGAVVGTENVWDPTAIRGEAIAGRDDQQTSIGSSFFQYLRITGTGIDIPLDYRQDGTGSNNLEGPTDPTLGVGVVFFGYGHQVQAFDTPTDCPPAEPSADNPAGNPSALNTCPARWRTDLDGFPTAPVLSPDGTVVYVGTSGGRLYALRADDGSVIWSRTLPGSISQPPALADGVLYVPVGGTRLDAVAASDGSALWSATTPVTHQPAVAGGVVYTLGAGSIAAFTADGCGSSSCTSTWSTGTGPGVTGGMAVAYGHLYVTTSAALLGFAPSA